MNSLPFTIIYLFAFLGPLGNLPCPNFFPYQFRAFYLILPTFFLFYFKLDGEELKTLLLFTPFLFYALISSYLWMNQPILHIEAATLSRTALFICEMFFMFGAAFKMRTRCSVLEKVRLIRFYLYGFFISLFIGYGLFIGYYLDWIPLKTLDRFTIMTQFGWGILRFSPGSYPNEYGIVSSFVASVLLLLLMEKKTSTFEWVRVSKKIIFFLFLLTFFALLLTTTRAAYLSFVFALFYILFISKSFRLFFCSISLVLSMLLTCLGFNFSFILDILVSALSPQGWSGESIQIRFEHWIESFQALSSFPLFGRGFGSLFFIHNVYLEFLSELGVFGSFILIAAILGYLIQHHKKIKTVFFKKGSSKQDLFSNRVIVLGLIHVFWFAATNHNINHHLTWMIFLLFNIHLFSNRASEQILDTSLKQRI